MQLKHLGNRLNHRYNLILKARQFGFTTLYCIDLLDEALWVSGTSCAIVAHDRESLENIFQIVKRAYTNLPDELKPATKTDTVRMYRFTNRFDGYPLDSSIYVALKLRSGTVQRLHISESAYVKDRAELVAGSKQAVPITGWISEETTGNGYEDFYDLYMQYHGKSKLTEMDYMTHFYPWFENNEYTLPGQLPDITLTELDLKNTYNLTDGQLLWRRWKMNELKVSSIGEGLTPEQLFKQEYPSTIQEAFQSGAGAVFNPEKLDNLKIGMPLANVGEKPEIQRLARIGMRFWKLPEYGKEYVIGVDPSDGEGADFACIDVWTTDNDKFYQCAQFYVKMRPDELAEITKDIAEVYNRAFIGVENNMLTTMLFLSKIYDNYFYETRIDEKTLKKTKKLGWNTNLKTRDVMIDEFAIYFDEDNLVINSPITLAEMRTFVKKPNGKREHADGKHDDALFAGMIALQMHRRKPQVARVFEQKPF